MTKTEAYKTIQMVLSNLVEDLLIGYRLHPFSMRGSQGEISRIDFIDDDGNIVRLVVKETFDLKGKTIIRIYEYFYMKDEDFTDATSEVLWLNEKHYRGTKLEVTYA